MTAIMAMVATATAVRRMFVDRGAWSSRQPRKAERQTLRARTSRAPFNVLVITPIASP
jgi:hypothetical protein